jgi:hypothetical protein
MDPKADTSKDQQQALGCGQDTLALQSTGNTKEIETVYIVGTQHPYQTGEVDESKLAKFQEMLRLSVEKYKIRGVGEEMCLAALKSHGIDGSVPFNICQELGLPHRYCDPDRATKDKLGINGDAARELFWLGQLRGLSAFPVLFICGAMHTKTFENLLQKSGFSTVSLYRNWPNPRV